MPYQIARGKVVSQTGQEECPTVGGALHRDVGAAGAADGGAAELHRHLDRVAGAVDRHHLRVSTARLRRALPCHHWSSRITISMSSEVHADTCRKYVPSCWT